MSDYLSEAELLGKPAGDGYLSEAELFAAPSDDYLSEAELLGEGRTFLGTAGDIGVSAAKSVVGLGESAVGLGNLATFGALGKGMDAIGYDPKGTQSYLSSLYSAPQQAANARVAQADGFVDTAGAMLDNPSTIGHSIIESGAPMLAGGAIGRGLLAAGGIVPGWIAGAVGEGAVSTGAAAEQLRQDDPDKTLGLGQAGAAIASGIGTTAFSMVGGRLANRLGLGDIDTLLASGADDTVKALGVGEVARRVIGGGISEGAFEELPQSVQEQVWMNAATGKPLLAGTGSAGAQGLITGAAMGSGTNAYTSLVDATQPSETVLSGASADEVVASFAAEVDSELRGLVAPTYAQAQAPTEAAGPTYSGALAEAPEQIRALVLDAGARHGVDPALLAAQLKAESNFDANAESPAGALGIAQFMPATAAEYGVDPLDPAQAIDGQARYMARMLERFGGDPAKALAAYNAGPGRVADGSWEGIPETRGYVDKVLADPGLSGQEPARAAETGEQQAETADPVDQVIAQADTGLDMAIAEPDAPVDAPVAPEGLLALEEEAAAPEAAVAPEVAVPAETVSTAVPETDFGDMPEIVPEQAVAIAPTEAATEPLVEAAPEEQPDRPATGLENIPDAALNTPEADAAPETPAAPRLGGITMEQVRTVPGADGVRLVHKETGEELLPGRTFATTREARDAFRQARSEEDKQGLSKDLRYSIAPDRSAARDADGRLNLGEISQEQATAMRRQPGAIRLAPGSHDQATGKGSGIAHIEARHGQEIRRAGYNSAEHLVADVVENHNEIRKGGSGSLLLVKRNGADKVAVVRLTKDASGEFYNVETAYLSRPSERRALLWSAAQSRSATPGGQPAFARESVVPSDQTTPNALPSSNAPTVAPDGTDVNEQRQPEATVQETKPATSESALIVDQQSGQAVTGDATADKTGDRTADVKAELGAALGRQRAERLIERGTVNVIATQAEAEAMVASAEQGNAPTVKRSENGRIQGLYLNGQVHLVADGIEAGKAHGVLLHELGEHARQLGFAKDAEYREILASLEQRKDARGATGKAIRAAMARVPESTPEADYWSEVAGYLVEEHADVQTSLIQRLVNFVKKWLFKAGAISAARFTPADLALFARAAVRVEAKGKGKGAKLSVRQSERGDIFKAVDVYSDKFKKWFGDWEEELGSARQDGQGDEGTARQPAGPAGSGTSGAELAGRPNADRRGYRQDQAGDRGYNQQPVKPNARDRGRAAPGLFRIDPVSHTPRVFYHGTKDDIAAFDIYHPNRKDTGSQVSDLI